MNDVLLNKAAIIERCVARVEDEFSRGDFRQNFTRQDAILMNIQRACEAAIDMGNHVIRMRKLGIPQSSRDAFAMLQAAGLMSEDLSISMQNMVGLRNIAVHDYQALNLDIVESVITRHLQDFTAFSQTLIKQLA